MTIMDPEEEFNIADQDYDVHLHGVEWTDDLLSEDDAL